jgi:hypothetical protein
MAITLPKINIIFKGLGASAIERGSKGTACLILVDATDVEGFHKYESIADFGTEEQAKFDPANVQYIKDVLEGIPKEVLVFTISELQTVTDILPTLEIEAPRNCWIAMADASEAETTDLVTYVKSAVTNEKKRYKLLAYNNLADSMHVVNYTNTEVEFVDDRGIQTGDKAIPYLLGVLAGMPLTMSVIAKKLSAKFKRVTEPEDVDTAIGNGEFVLINDAGVKVGRGVNSLTTTGEGVIESQKFIQVIEILDLMFVDIYDTWNENYKGKYQNSADNQALFISALTSYFKVLAIENLLDRNFDNKAYVDIERQRLANAPKYGIDVVNAWSEEEVKIHTYMSDVFLAARVKVLQAMEDLMFEIEI